MKHPSALAKSEKASMIGPVNPMERALATPPAAGYAGDLSPTEAWTMLKGDADAVLVDVRTKAEFVFVGIPDLSDIDKEPLMVPWKAFPSMEQNPAFVDQVVAECADKNAPLLFLCRSGGRSREAAIAMTKAGLTRCYNIATGFEGDADAQRHRNTVGGWRRDGLPWVQT